MSAIPALSAASLAAWRQSFLSSLPSPASDALLETAIELDAVAGQVLQPESDLPTTRLIGFVSTGVVRSYISSARGREVTIRHAKHGDVLGLPGLIGQRAPAAIQAVTDCRVVRLSVTTMLRLARTDPDVAWSVSREITQIMFGVQDMLADNVFKSVGERVAAALLEFAREQEGLLVVRISQQEIADSIGSVREVVARALGQLRSAGLIERRGQRTIICNPDALALLAREEAPAGPAARLVRSPV
jgi:CRP/FNR family cyclic AMP-dependent transcriptional regulator